MYRFCPKRPSSEPASITEKGWAALESIESIRTSGRVRAKGGGSEVETCGNSQELQTKVRWIWDETPFFCSR